MQFKNNIKEIECNGYTVFQQLIPKETIVTIKKELAPVEFTPADYSDKQLVNKNFHWGNCPLSRELIANPVITEFLDQLLGDQLICTSVMYTKALPGHPGIVLHTDSQPYGSEIFGIHASAPVLVRVLYYLDDLTSEKSPLRVIPNSHLSMHKDANPYNRYESHPDEMAIRCQAGSAVIINQKVFHGNGPNTSDESREMVAIAYRPAWAGPIAEVEDWPEHKVAGLPPHIRQYFGSLNSRDINYHLENRPDNMKDHAEGLNLNRWA